MQKGKNVHRGGRELGGALVLIVLICVPWSAAAANAAAADSSASECVARLLAGCPEGVASGNFFFGNSADGQRRAGFRATAANPYMLDGLVSSDLLCGSEGTSHSAWLDWSHLGHALYREDRFTAATGIPFPFRSELRLYAVAAIERRAVRGFGVRGSHSLSLAFSYDYRGSACVGYACRGFGSDASGPRNDRAFVFVRTGLLVCAVDGAVSGERGRDIQCALEVWLGDACALVSGYRWKTGELSSGLVVGVSRVILDFSWSRNPALGSTVVAGIGRLWEW